MTAISPLEFIHKKGIFGDHHKKNEADLLKIMEVKNLTIIQLVQYKNSKINLQDIKIEDLEIPEKSSIVNSNKETRILWNAQRTWIIYSSNENIIETINKNCKEKDFAITNISHSRAVIQIKGIHAREILKKGCPINLDKLQKNNCAGTIFHGITILVDFIDNNPDTYNLLTLRSFGESFYHHISDAALEFGYAGV